MISKEDYEKGLRCKGICDASFTLCKYKNDCYQYIVFNKELNRKDKYIFGAVYKCSYCGEELIIQRGNDLDSACYGMRLQLKHKCNDNQVGVANLLGAKVLDDGFIQKENNLY